MVKELREYSEIEGTLLMRCDVSHLIIFVTEKDRRRRGKINKFWVGWVVLCEKECVSVEIQR